MSHRSSYHSTISPQTRRVRFITKIANVHAKNMLWVPELQFTLNQECNGFRLALSCVETSQSETLVVSVCGRTLLFTAC